MGQETARRSAAQEPPGPAGLRGGHRTPPRCPDVDGDLEGPGCRGHAHRHLAIADGYQALTRPGRGAGGQQPGCLAAQATDRVGPGAPSPGAEPGPTPPAVIASCSTPIESLT